MCLPNTYACKGVFNPNIPIFASNSAEGLHFSAFHFFCMYVRNYYLNMFISINIIMVLSMLFLLPVRPGELCGHATLYACVAVRLLDLHMILIITNIG